MTNNMKEELWQGLQVLYMNQNESLPADLYSTGSIMELNQSDHYFRHNNIFGHIVNI